MRGPPDPKSERAALAGSSDIISRPPLPSLRGGRCRNEPAHKTAGDRPCSFEGLHARPNPRREPPAEAH
jgi:hypothetical protein